MELELLTSAAGWASIVTAGATAALAFLTWRTVRAMVQQTTAPKRDKHLEWIQKVLLIPLKTYLDDSLSRAFNDGLLPLETTSCGDKSAPKQLRPFDHLPLLRPELIAHFKELNDTLDAFLGHYDRFTDTAWVHIKHECMERIAEKLVDFPAESVLPYCYHSAFALTFHGKPQTILSADGKWHLKAESASWAFETELGTKYATDELGAALLRAASNSRSELWNEFNDISLKWRQLSAFLDLALATVQLKGKCKICPLT